MNGPLHPRRLSVPGVVPPPLRTDVPLPFASLNRLQLVGDDARGETGLVLPWAQTGVIWPRLRYVVIAETLPLFRDALAQLARSQSPDARIVRAGTVAEVLELASGAIMSDLFLIDLALPGMDICMCCPNCAGGIARRRLSPFRPMTMLRRSRCRCVPAVLASFTRQCRAGSVSRLSAGFWPAKMSSSARVTRQVPQCA